MMRKVALPAMRTDCNAHIFEDTCFAAKEPIMQFDAWFKEATSAEDIGEPNLMVLTTCGRECRPRARIVYLREYDETGFRFHTNYASLKGQQLKENPYACLLFFWGPLHRQVIIEGKVEKLTEKENEKQFHSSPRYHQIADLVSFNQSSVIASREILDDKEAKLKEEYADIEKVIPKPYYSGGFKLVPHQVEFWQGRPNRLHDRFVFRKPGQDEVIDESLTKPGTNGWVYERLAP